MAYRIYGSNQPYSSISTPPPQQRQASYGYTSSPNQQQSFGASYGMQSQQQPPSLQQSGGYGASTSSNAMPGLVSSGSGWPAQPQPATGTPSTAPKAFSWGLPIAVRGRSHV
jgi:hypothetical protein